MYNFKLSVYQDNHTSQNTIFHGAYVGRSKARQTNVSINEPYLTSISSPTILYSTVKAQEMQRNSLSQVRTESCMAAHRVGNTTVWAEKKHVLFLPSQNIFLTPLITNKTCFELKNIKNLPLHRASKWKVTLKSHTAGWVLGLWCMDVPQLEVSPPPPVANLSH